MSARLSALGAIAFRWLQRVGKALMLPVSVLPAAGLLLGIGSAQFGVIPAAVSGLMSQAGGAIFGNLPLIFAVSVALGLTAGEGAAALAAVVGFAVLVATMGVVAPHLGYAAESLRPVLGVTSIDTGVFGGLVIGTIVALFTSASRRPSSPPRSASSPARASSRSSPPAPRSSRASCSP